MPLLATPKLDLFFPFFPVPSSLSRPICYFYFCNHLLLVVTINCQHCVPQPPFCSKLQSELDWGVELNTAIAEAVKFNAAGQVVHQKTHKCNLPDNFLVVLSVLGSTFDTPPVHHISERQDLIFACTASIMTFSLLIHLPLLHQNSSRSIFNIRNHLPQD